MTLHPSSPTLALAPVVALICSTLVAPTQARAQHGTDVATFDTARIAAMRYRTIGPARGGRVTAVTGVVQQPATFYFGSTGGGVWKTTDAGQSWRNISEPYFASASIGSIDVADSDPNVIYVGTGSAGIRSNVSIGKGIYKSSDAGMSWKSVGLRDAGQIGRVVVHPSNPDIVYASVLGSPFANGPTRGVYRTRDGGVSWQRVLFLSDSTGSSDVELQPGHPNVVYASMWHGARRPWTIISGGAEDGIYRSTDGGEHWTKLSGGLPGGLFGKSDLSVSDAMPNRLYALVEAKPGTGLYRSDDAGDTWTAVNTTTPGIITRPFYYDHVHADPTNADVVYAGAEDFWKSVDGGRTFRILRTPHGDNHDMWINPKNGQIFIESNDGGATVTLNGGTSWSSELNQPTAEIYQVAADNQYPYRVYGAQQDEGGTLIVPSLPLGPPIDDPVQSWRQGPGCETGPVMPNRISPDTVYGGCKGQFSRMRLSTGQERQYWVGAQSLYGNANRDLRFRFQRVAPMEVSPHEPHTVYYGSQYIHRTRDDGVTWEQISPDLTANDPRYRGVYSGEPITPDATGEEMFAVVYAIRESPLVPGLIWVGANDGLIHVTRNGGKSWKNVTPTDLPPGGRVQNIEPSPLRPGTAYVAVLRYLLGDFHPYIYRTDDYGTTWARLTDGRNGIPADAPTRVVREDPDRAGLLYAGTEFGVYVSFDDGTHWRPFQMNLPITPVTDIRVHRKDLVLSTQGRAFWILDDLTPLHQTSDAVTVELTHLFAPREAIRYHYRATFSGEGVDRGTAADQPQYPPAGGTIDYWLARAPSGPITLEILDRRGQLVRRYASGDSGDGTRRKERLAPGVGLNRVVWDMTYAGPAGQRDSLGPMAAPGVYTVRLTANGTATTQPLVLRADPRAVGDGITQQMLVEQVEFNLKARNLVSDAYETVEQLRAARVKAGADTAAIVRIERELLTPPIRYSRPGLQAHIQYLYSMSLSADQQISHDARERFAELKAQLDELKKRMPTVR